MLISEDEIQKRRSPRELWEYAVRVEGTVLSASRSEYERGMLKKGLYKEFIDEVRPLSNFAKQHYPETYAVQPVLGNQGYDAIVYDETGAEYERIEMAFPHDGQETNRDAKLVLDRGYGQIVVEDPADDFDKLLPFVENTCKKKALKDYNDCIIVVYISALPPYAGFEDRYKDQVRKMVGCLSGIKFRAKRVLLFLYPDRVEQIAE